MGTEILRPHDVLAERFRFPQTTRKHHTNLFLEKKTHNHNTTTKKTSSPRPTDKKKHITLPRRKDDVIINNNQVKKVTILRRGESLDCLSSVKLPKEIKAPKGDTYAGSAFSMSPSPRSLPLPSFFNNKQLNEDPATRDLRRLLRLE